MSIHPTAVIDPGAEIASDVEVGPYTVIEDNVKIGPRVKIWANAYICRYTEIGEDTQVHMGAVIGHLPQDISFKDKKSGLLIGKRNVIREYSTIHRGTHEATTTLIGDDNFFMAFAHIGHNCVLGNNIVMVNGATLGGYVHVGDKAFLSAYAVVQQFTRIGGLCIIAANSRVTKDVPPYMLAKGEDCKIYGLNVVGLRRSDFSQETRNKIKKAHKILYLSGYRLTQAIEEIEKAGLGEEVRILIDFLKGDSKRGITANIKR
ncbi:MAG: acyl-ACP--UDP-N-acetylglucosamine O-acyltransferase [Candidatus Omnitrophica bacterium]|nr:acyl-ACP--UDP-N-acetylglucosamine O-acyltransferase [Candidatus Omnitrophota bacterium]